MTIVQAPLLIRTPIVLPMDRLRNVVLLKNVWMTMQPVAISIMPFKEILSSTSAQMPGIKTQLTEMISWQTSDLPRRPLTTAPRETAFGISRRLMQALIFQPMRYAIRPPAFCLPLWIITVLPSKARMQRSVVPPLTPFAPVNNAALKQQTPTTAKQTLQWLMLPPTVPISV